MKRSGPKMLPCGTPTDTSRELTAYRRWMLLVDERKGRTRTNLGSCHRSQRILIYTTE